MMFSFAPILKGLPMPASVHQPRRASVDVVRYEGTAMYRVVIHAPDDSPTCFGLGPTPEGALRTALHGLLSTIAEHGIPGTDAAVAYASRLTLN